MTKKETNNPLILHIESSSLNCSIAISKGSQSLTLTEESSDKYLHAEKMHLFIESALKKAKLSMSELDAIAVDEGPGSYTGLRIGYSSAKGLAYAMGIPLIAISSLEIIAFQSNAHPKTDYVIAMMDARRMEVYASIFEKGQCIDGPKAVILDENSFEDLLKDKKVLFLGDSNEKASTVIKSENALFSSNTFPSAANMIEIGADKFRQSEFVDVAYSEPFYLKDFIPGKPKKSSLLIPPLRKDLQ